MEEGLKLNQVEIDQIKMVNESAAKAAAKALTKMINKDTNPHKLQNMSGHKSYKSVTWYYQYSEDSLEHEINPIKELVML